MKRFLIVLLIAMMALPVFAQDSRYIFDDLDATFTVDDLGYRFSLPSTWYFEVNPTGGLYFAASQEDLALLLDEDDSTEPVENNLSIIGFPIEALELEDESLLAVTDTFIELTGLNVIERFEVSVMGYRATGFAGTNDDGDPGVAVLWIRDGMLNIFSMASPNEEMTSDEYYTFGVLLGTIVPVVAEDVTFAEEPYEITDQAFTITYPTAWTFLDNSDSSGFILIELEEDIPNASNNGNLIGSSIVIATGPADDFVLDPDADRDEYATTIADTVGITEFTIEEFSINGNLGLGITGNNEEFARSFFMVLTHNVEDSTVTLFALSAPDEESLAVHKPTFLAMLGSVRATG